ncbi:MAG: GlxA family transcriptional regulator [Maricaulaceae bacterium]|jgi:transcriptional regulator GlxA family with amidase domain
MTTRTRFASLDRRRRAPRKVAVVAFANAQVLDIAGPWEVLAGTAAFTDASAYEIELIAAKAGPLPTSGGLPLVAHRAFADVTPAERRGYDTLIVAGGNGTPTAMADRELIRFVKDVAKHARRVASVCSGAFILAQAGLLDGRRAATHWRSCARLAEMFPKVEVDADAIFVRDGKFWSSAGVTAGMDLALALVEEDLGREVALAVARAKVMFMIRPGGQSQYSAALAAQSASDDAMAELGAWICENVAAPLNGPDLAARANMSERTFARRFTAATGQTPARFVETARIDAARRALELTDKGVDAIAFECGFGAPERMRRAFHRRLGVSPADYRARFAARRLETTSTPAPA